MDSRRRKGFGVSFKENGEESVVMGMMEVMKLRENVAVWRADLAVLLLGDWAG